MTHVDAGVEPTRAIWDEAQAWAMKWAAKLYAEAPPEADGFDEHIRHQYERLWTDEVMGTFPEHLRQYNLRPGLIVREAITDYRESRSKQAA